MEQRQPRLGDILDDYCPRERRVTNHAVVAMVGSDVKQTRCTTCDAEHEYKHAKVPRQRRKADSPAALYAQVSANAPKRVAHESSPPAVPEAESQPVVQAEEIEEQATELLVVNDAPPPVTAAHEPASETDRDEGPVHRPLIRASLPRPEGQPPPSRPIPEFTIRQPGGRPGHFRSRHGRGGQSPQFHGARSGGGNNIGGGHPRAAGHRPSGRPPQGAMRRPGPGGRKRSK